jgi:hypothetical protein
VLFKFTLVLKSVLSFCVQVPVRYILELSMFSPLSLSKSYPSARRASVENVFVETVTYLEPKLFLLIIFYNNDL